jgi:hypothetical protein
MGRRDPDPRPPIEVMGAEAELTSVQRVATGPRRPTGGPGQALALGVGVVGLLLGGLALGGADDEPSSSTEREERDNRERAEIKPSTTGTTRPRSTTTRPPTTTTTIPVGPVFGQPVGAALLVHENGDWIVVDLDTGARRAVTLRAADPYSVRAVTGGVVVGGQGQRTAVFYDVLGGGEEPRSVDLGDADQVLSAGRPDRVWLIDSGGLFEGEPQSDTTTRARLVDLHGQVLRAFDLPGPYVAASVAEGLVLSRGGRAYLADEDGVRSIATGFVMGATADAVLLLACDDQAACALELRPLDGGRPTELLTFPGIEDMGFEASVSRDGDLGVMGFGGQDGAPTLWLFTRDGRAMGSYDTSSEVYGNGPRWLPDGLGLLVLRGGRPEWIRFRDGIWVVQPTPALEGLRAETALVIQP